MKRFSGKNGQVQQLHAVRLEWRHGNNARPQMVEIAGSEFTLDVDHVLDAHQYAINTPLIRPSRPQLELDNSSVYAVSRAPKGRRNCSLTGTRRVQRDDPPPVRPRFAPWRRSICERAAAAIKGGRP
jgi:hypothetical protein